LVHWGSINGIVIHCNCIGCSSFAFMKTWDVDGVTLTTIDSGDS
jgi:hypothetical protein